MKIIFAGTSEFGIPTLEKIKDQLILIITRPDKPAGRDKKITAPPIKLWAQKNNIPFAQPEKLLTTHDQLQTLQPDLLLVAAYGQIISKEILDIPKFGSINIHGSILPKYRGASPIQSAILNGDPQTGITLLKMDEKMDHGPIIATKTIAIDGTDSFSSLYKKMSLLAADLVLETLPKWFAGEIKPIEQNHEQATFTKLLAREDGKIDWAQPAVEIERKIRAFNPEPGTWTKLQDKTIKILEVGILSDHKIELPGKLYTHDGQLVVKCLDNGLIIKKLKPEGRNEMSGRDFLNGLRDFKSRIFI